MEARSYVENIATRTAILRAIEDMTRNASIGLALGAAALMFGTGFHPAGVIIGGVLAVFALIVARHAVRLARERRSEPLDLAFEAVPGEMVPSPGRFFGAAGGLALFGVTFAALSLATRPDMTLTVGGGLLGAAVLVAFVSVPALHLERRRWSQLAATPTPTPSSWPTCRTPAPGSLRPRRSRSPRRATR